MKSLIDFTINLLDSFAFFLVAPDMIGERKLRNWHRRWNKLFGYLYSPSPWLPKATRIKYAFVAFPIIALSLALFFKIDPAWAMNAYYVLILFIPATVSLAWVFVIAARHWGFIRVTVICGTAVFVMARVMEGGKAAGFWG